jgi:hypothetical protein
MKSIIIFLAFFVAINATAQTNDTTKIRNTTDTISFYKNYKAIRDARITGLCTGIAGGLLSGYGVTRENAYNMFTYLGGICGVVSFICYIVEISEYNYLAKKHKNIKFVGDKIIVNF